MIPEGKEKVKDRQAVFVTPTNPFGNYPEEEIAHNDFTVSQKVPHITRWQNDQNAVCWVRLSRAQDQGLEFWQTKSFAIMTNGTIPGDCIDRVTSQDGDRVLFERLETPRPAQKVKLKMNWHSQQQQQKHSTSDTHVPSSWKQGVKREDQAGAQDVTDHSIEADLATRKLVHTSSKMDVDTQVNTHALLKDGTVKEEFTETNSEAIDNIKMGSNKNCTRDNLAKEKMVFSQESSQAIFDMGNVELTN